jgi:hypothetical protein
MVPRVSGPVFMFCVLELIFGGTEGVGFLFRVLRARTHFRRYRGRRVPFSCFRSRTCFRRYRGRLVSFSCFTLPDTFSTMRRASGPVLMFCALGLFFCGSEGFRSRFHVLRPRIRFRCFRGRRVSFSCFASAYSFSAVPRASGTFFMFCAPELIFGGTYGVGSRFHLLHSRTSFQRFRGCRVLFSCFASPYKFLAVPRASGPVFLFCALGIIFDGSEGVGSSFHFLPTYSFSIVPRASGPIFMYSPLDMFRRC